MLRVPWHCPSVDIVTNAMKELMVDDTTDLLPSDLELLVFALVYLYVVTELVAVAGLKV